MEPPLPFHKVLFNYLKQDHQSYFPGSILYLFPPYSFSNYIKLYQQNMDEVDKGDQHRVIYAGFVNESYFQNSIRKCNWVLLILIL